MDFIYTEFDREVFQNVNREKIKRLFLDVLNKLSGDAEGALRYLERQWERHNLEDALGMSFGDVDRIAREHELVAARR